MELRGRISALSVMTIVSTMSATAQSMSYGADSFENQYRMTVGQPLHLYATVVSHPMSEVKGQIGKLCATNLAEQGFVTVSLNHSF